MNFVFMIKMDKKDYTMIVLAGVGVLLFGRKLIVKGVKDFISIKKEIKNAVNEENKKENIELNPIEGSTV